MSWLRPPPAPVGVTLVLPDGRTVAAECVYAGRVGGIHTWDVIRPVGVRLAAGMQVRVSKLPARTRICLPMADPDGGA